MYRQHRSRWLFAGPSAACTVILVGLLGPVARAEAAAPELGTDPVVSQVESRVPLGDLDLRTEHGLQLALQRVHTAARSLCNRVADPEDLGRSEAFARCGWHPRPSKRAPRGRAGGVQRAHPTAEPNVSAAVDACA
jgi:UrcA family protein